MLHGNLESFLARLHLCNNMKTSSKNIFYATRFLLLVSMIQPCGYTCIKDLDMCCKFSYTQDVSSLWLVINLLLWVSNDACFHLLTSLLHWQSVNWSTELIQPHWDGTLPLNGCISLYIALYEEYVYSTKSNFDNSMIFFLIFTYCTLIWCDSLILSW